MVPLSRPLGASTDVSINILRNPTPKCVHGRFRGELSHVSVVGAGMNCCVYVRFAL